MDRFIGEMRYKLAKALGKISKAVAPPSPFGPDFYSPPVQKPEDRPIYIGFASPWVCPGQTVDVPVLTQFDCRLVGALVAGTARYFEVESVRVGRDDRLHTSVPAAILPQALHARFEDARSWPSSLQTTLRIRNMGKKTHRLRGALVVQCPKGTW